MNCQEALDLLYQYLDKEISQVDTKQVQDHLDKCRPCFERYKLETDVNAFIQSKIDRDNTCPKAVRDRILTKLDDIDREEGAVSGRKPPFWRTSYALAAAAFLIVTIGAAYLVAGFFRHNDLYIPLERAHWNAESQLHTYQNASFTSAAFAYAADTIGYELSTGHTYDNLVGGHTEVVDGVRMAHFVYRNPDGGLVSVFIAPSSQFDIPGDLEDSPVQRDGISFFRHYCRGCRLAFHRAGNAVVVTATTDRARDLLDFVPGRASI